MVQVETWFQEDGKLAAQRDFVMTDGATGQVLGRATSTWVMINMNVRSSVAAQFSSSLLSGTDRPPEAAGLPPAPAPPPRSLAGSLAHSLPLPLRALLPPPPLNQTRRLIKFPDTMRQKCDAFQLDPPRHAIPRAQTRQKLPDVALPAEVRARVGWHAARSVLSSPRGGPPRPLPLAAWLLGGGVRWCARACSPPPLTAAPRPPSPLLPLLLSGRPQIVGPVQVARRSDVDMNGHVNNTCYLVSTERCGAAVC